MLSNMIKFERVKKPQGDRNYELILHGSFTAYFHDNDMQNLAGVECKHFSCQLQAKLMTKKRKSKLTETEVEALFQENEDDIVRKDFNITHNGPGRIKDVDYEDILLTCRCCDITTPCMLVRYWHEYFHHARNRPIEMVKDPDHPCPIKGCLFKWSPDVEKRDYTKHWYNVHGMRMFFCPTCGEGYHSPDRIRAHTLSVEACKGLAHLVPLMYNLKVGATALGAMFRPWSKVVDSYVQKTVGDDRFKTPWNSDCTFFLGSAGIATNNAAAKGRISASKRAAGHLAARKYAESSTGAAAAAAERPKDNNTRRNPKRVCRDTLAVPQPPSSLDEELEEEIKIASQQEYTDSIAWENWDCQEKTQPSVPLLTEAESSQSGRSSPIVLAGLSNVSIPSCSAKDDTVDSGDQGALLDLFQLRPYSYDADTINFFVDYLALRTFPLPPY
jgi:hypothetical protein